MGQKNLIDFNSDDFQFFFQISSEIADRFKLYPKDIKIDEFRIYVAGELIKFTEFLNEERYKDN